MKIEEEIFKRSNVNFAKLEPFGFKKEGNSYFIDKYILNNTFLVKIEIFCDGSVVGKVYDLEFDCEYTNFRIEKEKGKFVNQIKEEFINILIDIKNNCFDEKYFVTNQANRIANLVKEEYNDIPEFLWKNSPHGGI